MNLPLIIVGAGAHACVVADALLLSGERVLGFIDIDEARHGQSLCGLPVLGDDRALQSHNSTNVALANGIGGLGDTSGASTRQRVQQRLMGLGWRFIAVRHPSAVISPFARIAPGTQLLAACVIQPAASLGEGVIVNTAAVVEHHVELEAWVHVAPGAVVCGSVRIGARSHIGAGAVIRQGLRIGADTLVGAGAVVVRNFAGPGVLVGVPARLMEAKS